VIGLAIDDDNIHIQHRVGNGGAGAAGGGSSSSMIMRSNNSVMSGALPGLFHMLPQPQQQQQSLTVHEIESQLKANLMNNAVPLSTTPSAPFDISQHSEAAILAQLQQLGFSVGFTPIEQELQGINAPRVPMEQQFPSLMNQTIIAATSPVPLINEQQQQKEVSMMGESITTRSEETVKSSRRSGYYLNVIYNTYNPKHPDSSYNIIHRGLFPNTKYMSAEEIESIVRQQMQDLLIKNPFLDDFYFYLFTHKKSIEAKKVSPEFANWIHEALSHYSPGANISEEELKRREMLAQQPRVFGRIPSQSVRAPRAMFEIEQELKDLQYILQTSASTLHRDRNAHLNLLIENGLVHLIQIREFSLCLRNSEQGLSQQEIQEYFALCQLVIQMLQLTSQDEFFNFFKILEKKKGIRFVSKSLRLLPEPFIIYLLKRVLTDWGVIFTNFISRQDDAEELKQQFIKDTVAGIGELSPIALCQTLHSEDSMRDGIMNINYQTFFANGGLEVLNAILKRALEVISNDPLSVDSWQSNFNQLFKELRRYGFARIANEDSKHGWQFLTSVLTNCYNDELVRCITDDLKSFLTQKPTPYMAEFYQQLMKK
jgi:hypothetical protein